MSWHYSQALVAAYLEGNSSDGAPSAQSRLRNTRGTSYLRGKMTAQSPYSPSGTMCEPSTASRGAEWWISSLAASRAKTSPSQAKARASMGNARGCGRKCEESLARFDPLTSSWKTPQLLLFGGARVIGDLASMGYMGRNCCLGGFSVGGCANGERMWIVATSSNSAMLEGVDIQKHHLTYSEESCRRQYTGAVRAMLSQDDYSEVKRNADDVAAGMDRLKAIGNGQNPIVAATACNQT